MDFFLIAELVINGVFVGLMYALVSLGIVLIYKTSGLVNLAQGALAMTGAYITWMVGNYFGMPIWVSIPAAVVLMFFGGVFIERSALRRMIGQPVIMAIMLTLGIELALRGLLPGVFGAGRRGDDVMLRDGDVIWVERQAQIYLYGEVQRPGAVRMERDMTVMQALATVGGLNQRGTEKGLRIHRRNPTTGQVQTLEPKMTDIVQANDVVFVRESLF